MVEIPRQSRNKYEYDEEAHVFRLDRVLSSAVFYNFDYGFIEGTRAGDGDHTDALLIIDEPTFTGCHVWARPIGGLEMRDEKGFDFKVLCVAIGDAHQQHIERLEQVRPHRLVEIEHFFETYKALEDKTVDVLGWRERERALDVLRDRPRPPGSARRANDPGDRVGSPTALAGCRPARPAPLRRRADPVGGRGGDRRGRRAVRAGGVPGRRPRRPLGPARRPAPDAAVPRPDARRPHRPRGGGDRAAAAAGAPFDVSIGGAGAFPSRGRPRALWLDIRDGRGVTGGARRDASIAR